LYWQQTTLPYVTTDIMKHRRTS